MTTTIDSEWDVLQKARDAASFPFPAATANDGHIWLNQHCTEMVGNLPYCYVRFNRKNGAVGIIPTKNYGRDSYRMSRKENGISISCAIGLRKVLGDISRRYRAERVNEMVVLWPMENSGPLWRE